MTKTTHVTRGRDLAPALLKALGYDVDTHWIKSFAIYWRAEGPPLIRITEYATVEQEQALVEAVTVAGEDIKQGVPR